MPEKGSITSRLTRASPQRRVPAEQQAQPGQCPECQTLQVAAQQSGQHLSCRQAVAPVCAETCCKAALQCTDSPHEDQYFDTPSAVQLCRLHRTGDGHAASQRDVNHMKALNSDPSGAACGIA